MKREKKLHQKQGGTGKISEYTIADLLGSVPNLGVIVPLVRVEVAHHIHPLSPEVFLYLLTRKKILAT